MVTSTNSLYGAGESPQDGRKRTRYDQELVRRLHDYVDSDYSYGPAAWHRGGVLAAIEPRVAATFKETGEPACSVILDSVPNLPNRLREVASEDPTLCRWVVFPSFRVEVCHGTFLLREMESRNTLDFNATRAREAQRDFCRCMEKHSRYWAEWLAVADRRGRLGATLERRFHSFQILLKNACRVSSDSIRYARERKAELASERAFQTKAYPARLRGKGRRRESIRRVAVFLWLRLQAVHKFDGEEAFEVLFAFLREGECGFDRVPDADFGLTPEIRVNYSSVEPVAEMFEYFMSIRNGEELPPPATTKIWPPRGEIADIMDRRRSFRRIIYLELKELCRRVS